MSRKGKNKRRESKRSFKPAKQKKTKQHEDEGNFLYKQERKHTYNKRYLILCEGITEKAYFLGLKYNILLHEKFRAVKIEIIAPPHDDELSDSSILMDNSLKGLVWEAMKRKRKADKEKNPFDEIWIVIDNDERNSFVISTKTLDRAKELLSQQEQFQFESHLGDFFLSERHYQEFLLQKLGLEPEKSKSIIQLTDKNILFEDLEDQDPKRQFYTDGLFTYGQDRKKDFPEETDFDKNWKSWIRKAYSCRTFENWLILHFECNKIPFTVSSEDEITEKSLPNPQNSIHHLWEFAPTFCKGFDKPQKGKISAYNILKPQPYNPKYETEAEAQAVIDKVNAAIIRSFWLRKEMESELSKQSGKYYEVNPWTDTNYLLSSLLEIEVFYGEMGDSLEFEEVQICCEMDKTTANLQVTLQNLSPANRLLINNANVGTYFNMLGISGDNTHRLIPAHSISETINLPPGETDEKNCVIRFAEMPEGEGYLVIQYGGSNRRLYLPI